MPDVSFTNLLVVAGVAVAVPLALGWAPRLRVPSVVLEIVAGVLLGPSVLGWVEVDVPGSYVLGDGLEGTTRLVVDEASDVLVGAAITGSGVQELLHSAAVAVAGRLPLSELRHAVPAFPTVAEVWAHALDADGV